MTEANSSTSPDRQSILISSKYGNVVGEVFVRPLPEGSKEPAKMTFLEARGEHSFLTRKGRLEDKEKKRLELLNFRMGNLIDDLEQRGGLESVEAQLSRVAGRLNSLKAQEQSGELRPEHVEAFVKDLDDSIVGARQITLNEPEGVYKGIAEEVLTSNLMSIESHAINLEAGKIPSTEEAQRRLIIGLVEEIESSDLPISPLSGTYASANPGAVHMIEKYLTMDGVLPEIRREAVARLRLQHCFAIASGIPGSTDQAAGYLYSAFQNPESLRWALEGEDFDLLLKKGIKGLKISDAFEILQRYSLEGVNLADPGRPENKKRLTSSNLTFEEKNKMEKMMRLELGLAQKSAADKSFQLANRIARATLETSVWNKELTGSDPIAEAIHLQRYRTTRLAKGRDRGPDITVPRILGIGTSFFRGTQTLEKIELPKTDEDGHVKRDPVTGEVVTQKRNAFLFLPDPDDHLDRLSETKILNPYDRLLRLYERNTGEKPNANYDPENPETWSRSITGVNVKDLDYKNIAPGSFSFWLSIGVYRLLYFKSLLLNSTWKPEDFSADKIESYVAPANNADPSGVQRIRAEFVLGVLGSVYSRVNEAVNNGWDSLSLNQVTQNLSREIETKDGKRTPSFLTKEQMKWVKDTLKNGYGINIAHQAALVNALRTSVRKILSS